LISTNLNDPSMDSPAGFGAAPGITADVILSG
jgi:hypothetical protein